MLSKVVAIHQPNFFPWLGYFDKLVRADIFVMLDSVQFQKKGGTWSNRVKVLDAGQARWLTAPVNRKFTGVRAIREMRFDESTEWRGRLLETIRQAYAHAPHKKECLDLIDPLLLNREPLITAYNHRTIMGLADALDLNLPRIEWASTLDVPPVGGTALLAAIVRAVGGEIYLSGDGAGEYQDKASYEGSGVTLQLQRFIHPTYPQGGVDFVPGLSIIDSLMNTGLAATSALLKKADV